MSKKIRRLIETAYRKGDFSAEGKRAIDELTALGEPGLESVLQFLDDPPETELHVRDVADTVNSIFADFARTIPDNLIECMRQGRLPADTVFWALAHARGAQTIDELIEGLKHREPGARWAAAEALVQRRSKRAVGPLLERLRDRSSSVRVVVVWAMYGNKMYRRPEALPALEKIVASKAVQKHSVGLLRTTREVIKKIRREQRAG